MSRPFVEFIHPDDLDATAAVAGSLSEGPDEVVNFENRYRTKDGSWRWLLWSSRSDEHRKYAVARDITDRKRLEQERLELLDRVEAMARTDQLTGLPNRRTWEEEFVKRSPAPSATDVPSPSPWLIATASSWSTTHTGIRRATRCAQLPAAKARRA